MVEEKKQLSGGVKRRPEESEEEDGYSTSSSYAPSAIDVSFNYVAPTEIDFTALKRLVQQLYHTHASEIDVGALADHIITLGDAEKRGADAALGTVVKVEDDEDGDPFAFASAIDLSANVDETASKTLHAYYAKTLKETNKAIVDILTKEHVVQIFHERMINMPPQIMPPLYRMLFDEINANASLSKATHFLFFSRVFSTASLDNDDEMEEDGSASLSRKGEGASSSKKVKKNAVLKNQAITKVASGDVGLSSPSQAEEIGLFHPEDTFLAKRALYTSTFRFPSVKDSDDSFNAPMYGRIALIKNDATLIDSLLQQMTEAFTLSA